MNFDMQTASDYMREHYREFVFTVIPGGKPANDFNEPLTRSQADELRRSRPAFVVVKK